MALFSSTRASVRPQMVLLGQIYSGTAFHQDAYLPATRVVNAHRAYPSLIRADREKRCLTGAFILHPAHLLGSHVAQLFEKGINAAHVVGMLPQLRNDRVD